MSVNAPTKLHPIPTWIIFICQQIATLRGFLWTNAAALIVNLLTWLLTTSNADREQAPLTSIIGHWPLYVGILVIAEAVFGLAAIIGNLPVLTKSPQKLRREYLASLVGKMKKLNIEGLPAHSKTVIPSGSVMLDEIFIPLYLKPHKSIIDHPLTLKYRKLLRNDIGSGHIAKEAEAVLIQAAQEFESTDKSGSITMQALWQRLTYAEPAAVIQGTPGMGKSTLLLRLALHMARHRNGEKDDIAGQTLAPILTPVFISLRYYARYRQKTNEEKQKSLKAYLTSLPDEMTELSSPDTVNWLLGELSQGRCLVLFDALDEVNDPQERDEVKTAIENFVNEVHSQNVQSNAYTRFIITSRIAGYKPNTFLYPHYTLAELTEEQIKDFLPRWCRASAQRNLQDISTEEQRISREATLIERDILDALENYQGFAQMAENPFLLTLLIIMRQNNLALPHRRIKLYEQITQIFLGSRNTERKILEIPEVQALQRLGPVAYQLQASKNDFMTQDEVRVSIIKVLTDAAPIPYEQALQETNAFLTRVRERGGIFVFRTEDFLGFFHRTFREYFAARYLLDRLAVDPTKEQENLLAKARDMSGLWREPFLLAMAYDGKLPDAQRLMKLLLTGHKGNSREQHAHDVLLVGQCLIEAEVAAIPYELEQQIILALLEIYQDALAAKNDQVYNNVEKTFISLLQGVSNENQYSALLQTLQKTLNNAPHATNLHTLLTLLLVIAPQLRSCADVVCAKLVPPLLGLAGLPAIGKFAPMSPTSSPDFDTIDGALSVLRELGAAGPAGAALKEEQARFEPYLEQLARYSLERGLITPTLIPFTQDNFKRYEQALTRWIKLRQQSRSNKERELEEAVDIQRELFQATEELHYPAYILFLEMLKRSQNQTDWQAIWQQYLSEQIEKGVHLDYQVCALLWTMLFPETAQQQALVIHLKEHFYAAGRQYHLARRFMLKLVSYLSYFRDLSDFRDLSYFRDSSDLSYLRYFRDSSDLSYFRDSSVLSYLSYFRDSSVLSVLSVLNSNIFTKSTGQKIEQCLKSCSEEQECTELLLLLLGRILQIQEGKEIGTEVEEEIHHLVEVAMAYRTMSDKTAVVVFDIIRVLPARTEPEISYILKFAQNEQDKQIQQACAEALQRSRPQDDDAWAALESAQTSNIPTIREAAKQRLEWRQRMKV